ncbi:cathelicidin-6-like isoform X2 [Eleutherodactylus coqui]|uniref:cathelicidin-6-like isoform X2 n=1 Tax=Eleutherodactylus coqui TaxID=57060 RepID=UPI003462A65C
MGRFLQVCLILRLAAMLYSASISRSSPPQRPVDDALDVYNEGLSSSGFLFAILQDKSHDNENIRFIIKETVCLKSGEKAEKCPFKEDGVVKSCTASLSGSKERRLDVSCQTVGTSSEENKKPKTAKSHHIAKHLRNGKKKLGTNFLQFDKSSLSSHAAASCISCIFDSFKPKADASGR